VKLYKISQTANLGYDVYDSAIVAAPSKTAAKLIHPSNYVDDDKWYINNHRNDNWTTVDNVKVEYIGLAAKGTKKGVILASYNAG